MTKYAAFLRGVNVGGRVIKMADLKACLEQIGLTNVKTLLQSGNIIFESDSDADELKKAIEAALSEQFHYPAKAQVFAMDELQAIADKYPFGTAGQQQHDYVIFFENNLEKAVIKEQYDLKTDEKAMAGKGVVYWRVDKGLTLKSDFAKWLAKAKYKDFNTNRNLRTITKILNS